MTILKHSYNEGTQVRAMDAETQSAIFFLKNLFDPEQIRWPIDFVGFEPSNEELAETFGCWFGGQRWSTSGDTFVQFGEDGTGSMFLLWWYPGLTTKPPVVFMGSEGESCLVSNNIEDFIRQLGSGKLFSNGNWYLPSLSENDDVEWESLQRLIYEKIERGDETPEQLSEKARRMHPDFTLWVESMVEYE